MTDEVTKRRVKLGVELREARTAARMTQAQAAAKLGCRQGKINKIETTQCAISPRDVLMLLAIYDPPEPDKVAIQMLAAHTVVVPASSRSRAYLELCALEPGRRRSSRCTARGCPACCSRSTTRALSSRGPAT